MGPFKRTVFVRLFGSAPIPDKPPPRKSEVRGALSALRAICASPLEHLGSVPPWLALISIAGSPSIWFRLRQEVLAGRFATRLGTAIFLAPAVGRETTATSEATVDGG